MLLNMMFHKMDPQRALDCRMLPLVLLYAIHTLILCQLATVLGPAMKARLGAWLWRAVSHLYALLFVL